jgi:hypothetical protein
MYGPTVRSKMAVYVSATAMNAHSIDRDQSFQAMVITVSMGS